MLEQNTALHYVCTHDEAWQLVKDHKHFWISNCDCRERRGKCTRSRIDLCLDFKQTSSSGGSNTKVVTLAAVKDIFDEAKVKHLITRPFRNTDNYQVVDGICFCCDDCCEYFMNPQEKCDNGEFIEKTDMDICTDCGLCVEVCYFAARRMENETLRLSRENCYGCGLCVDMCAETCIEMVRRD